MKAVLPTIKGAFTGLCMVFAAAAVHAGDVPSCYGANRLQEPIPERAIFVLIDQTTLLNPELRRSVMNNVGNYLKPGTSFTIGAFSAYTQGRYLEIKKTGTMEDTMPDAVRNSVKLKTLDTFDACLAAQWDFGLKTAAGALTEAMAGASGTLAKSDVEASIRALSDVVRESTARHKVVLIVSDMLENSTISSFYGIRSVRLVNPAREMALAKTANMLGDFGGARVFVLGAGLLPEDKKGVYRDPKTMNALKGFWATYFKSSNAELVEFGQPALLQEIK